MKATVKRYGQTAYASLGDISTSKVWLSVELKPWRREFAWPFIGPTYNGTKTGLYLSLGPIVAIGHVR